MKGDNVHAFHLPQDLCMYRSLHLELFCSSMLTLLYLTLYTPPSFSGLIVNFMCQIDWAMGAQIYGQMLFRVCLEGCFWMRLIFQSVD